MPRATWGAGDKALTADDINGAERQETTKRYSGPLPMAGTYRWVIQSLKKETSSNDNPMVRVFATLDGSWMPNHEAYDGCPFWDRIPVMQSTKERLANFLDSIGATGEDLLEKTVLDEQGMITKLGAVGDPKGIIVYITVKQSKKTPEYPNPKLESAFNAYIPVEEDGPEGADASGSEDPPPF